MRRRKKEKFQNWSGIDDDVDDEEHGMRHKPKNQKHMWNMKGASISSHSLLWWINIHMRSICYQLELQQELLFLVFISLSLSFEFSKGAFKTIHHFAQSFSFLFHFTKIFLLFFLCKKRGKTFHIQRVKLRCCVNVCYKTTEIEKFLPPEEISLKILI